MCVDIIDFMLPSLCLAITHHACAMHSISITVPSPGGTACRQDLEGIGCGRKSIYTSFIAAKSFMSARYTLYFTTCSRDEPESSKTSFRFCRTLRCVLIRSYSQCI